MYLMGVDVGTTGCKAAVFTHEGKTVALAYREYPTLIPKTGWMELDPCLVSEKVFSCISECTRKCDAHQIIGLSISTQGEAVVPVSESGEVLANSILTFDSRCDLETEWLSQALGKEKIYGITGAPLSSIFTLPKILWFRNNQGDVFKNVWKFMCYGDFIAYRLGAEPCIDYSMASRTLLFDIRQKIWSQRIFDDTELKTDLFSSPVESSSLIGYVSSSIARDLGLPEGTPIFSGGHDQVCCALGCGVLENGIAMDSLGTTESILTVRDEFVITDSMKKNNIPCYVYPVNDLYAYFSFLSSCGSILRWFRDEFVILKDSYSFAELNDEAEKRHPHPTNIFVLPHFSGSGTPYLDSQSKGIIAGLSIDTDVFAIYKAVLEGTCFECRNNIQIMEKCGIPIEQLRCIGGGAKSDLWLQIKADITGKTVSVPEVTEAGCAGAAMLVGIGAGIYSNAQEAIDNFVNIKKTFSPVPEIHDVYSKLFEKYQTIYKNNSGLFRPII